MQWFFGYDIHDTMQYKTPHEKKKKNENKYEDEKPGDIFSKVLGEIPVLYCID